MRVKVDRIVVAVVLLPLVMGTARGESWQEVRDRVDELIETRLREQGIEPGPACSETTLLRRTYLDLTGVIPTVGEVRAHLADTSEGRHERLVDRLIGDADTNQPPSPRFAGHLATLWTRTLLADTDNRVVQFRAGQFEGWLRERFAANVPYDDLVRELLVAEGNLNDAGPVLYYIALEVEPEKLAASTARSFLGVQMECAQCHDHPFDRWTQRDFWGYAAFFAQLRRGGTVPGRIVSAVEDTDFGEVGLPDTDEVIPPRFLGDETDIDERDDTRPRRERLAEWVVAEGNPYFARATVNRAWAVLFGYGLVDPVDDFGAHNPASHPAVLDLLAEDFAANGHDLQRTLRILANTDAYARTSVVREGEEFDPRSYARMPIKSLTGEQVYDAIARATLMTPGVVTNPYTFGRGTPGDRTSFLAKFRGADSATEFQGGIPRTLTLANGPFVTGRTSATDSDLLISVAESPFLDDAAAVETLFLATVSRPPSSEERERFVTHVEGREPDVDRAEPLADVLWALINSGEFLFNH